MTASGFRRHPGSPRERNGCHHVRMTNELDVTISDARARAEDGAVWIDVREIDEWNDGHIPHAQLHPLSRGVQSILDAHPDHASALNVVCAVGGRSMQVVVALRELGYTNARNVSGGLAAWRAAQLPIER